MTVINKIGFGFAYESDLKIEKSKNSNVLHSAIAKIKLSEIEKHIKNFAHKHSYISFVLFMVGLPLCSLLAVLGIVAGFIVPLALLFGWI